MKILLVDVDSKIPNIALMKISMYHKSVGDSVGIKVLGLSYYPRRTKQIIVDADGYDKVFASAIFFESHKYVTIINADDVSYGGTGYSVGAVLPDRIEKSEQDYSLYPENDISYGFITRGCIRNCEFCVVPRKEGAIHLNSSVDDIVKHDRVKFLDNNFLAYEGHIDILEELYSKKIVFQFIQGLDIRLINEDNAEILSRTRYIGDFIFAFDYIQLEKLITQKLELFREFFKVGWHIMFYVYCNANHDIGDVVHRVEWCRSNNVLPYLMRDMNCWDGDSKDFYTDLAAYCNQPSIFKKMTPEQYINKRQPKNIDRRNAFLNLYNTA